MKLINSEVNIIKQEPGLQGIYKQIEYCGRTCYKSLDKITENSAKDFVDRMIKSNHTATLEQSAVYLKVPVDDYNRIIDDHDFSFFECPYIYFNGYGLTYYICLSTNLRVLYQFNYMQLLDFIVNPTDKEFDDGLFERRITAKFICDRGVSHELVRHRKLSFMQESSRYCNYSKEKFGNEITYIIPYWSKLIPGVYKDKRILDTKDDIFVNSCIDAESNYLGLINFGCNPGEARQVLTNALKTEVCVTGFLSDWRYFFSLRYFGTTGNPHPDIQKLASDLYIQFKQNNYIQ